jgi:hypothetical protein
MFPAFMISEASDNQGVLYWARDDERIISSGWERTA